ncbi:helix-turn-helix transcriptional regulator [Hymenobacter sp. GOD-10R]|uniref:helix-turn-helix domain-containing protein n=1 Tax=Hymenobacter sp. GOD-10R TaxID=3093922 RepID=UPI002D78C0D9|nr:helix-turn-helix transcriptional regulator [Hymenobacter sp. GOD-10R]WRQ31113.1 helix-turn-helix transcriptional regulator [Hymenobacter sp. GOD-10R]
MRPPTMTFQEFVPSPALRPYVDRYWLVETFPGEAYPMEHALTPNALDGFVFQYHTQGPHLFWQAGRAQVLPAAYALLQPVSPWRLQLPAACCIAGVFFRPGVVHRWLRYPMPELTQGPLDLETLAGPAVQQLLAQLAEVPATLARVALLEAFVARRLPVLTHLPTATDYALRLLVQHRGNISVEALAGQLRVSRQFLARQFAEHVGRSPKQVGRVVRFNAVHQQLVQQPQPDWLDLVCQYGYYDQTHLIKEFRTFTGCSPLAYQQAWTEAADFYAGTAEGSIFTMGRQ